jgi:hypothetical protein
MPAWQGGVCAWRMPPKHSRNQRAIDTFPTPYVTINVPASPKAVHHLLIAQNGFHLVSPGPLAVRCSWAIRLRAGEQGAGEFTEPDRGTRACSCPHRFSARNRIDPRLVASTTFSASSGFSSSVTTLTLIGLPSGVGMNLLPHGQNHHILQHRQRLWLRESRWNDRSSARRHGFRAAGSPLHPPLHRNERKSPACPMECLPSGRRRLPPPPAAVPKWVRLWAADKAHSARYFADLGEAAGKRRRCVPFNQLQAPRFQQFACIERLSRGNIKLLLCGTLHEPPWRPVCSARK